MSTAEAAALPTSRRPYRPSWVDWLQGRVADLPGSTWAAYLAVTIVGLGVINGVLWATGSLTGGSFGYQATVSFLFAVGSLALLDYLNDLAGSRLDAFAPALAVDPSQVERLRYELTVLPARSAALASVLAIVVVAVSFQADAAAAEFAKLPVVAQIVGSVVELATIALLGVLIYHTIHQLLVVSRIHALATRIDLFDQRPLHAFSTLTMRTGLGLIAVAGAILLYPGSSTYVSTWVMVVILMACAVGVFVLPLRGMQQRIAAEKERLVAGAEQRLRTTLERLDRAVDSGDLAGADDLNRTLASQIVQRDIIAKLPTWPWSAGTLRGFTSALLLPIALWAVQRALERVV